MDNKFPNLSNLVAFIRDIGLVPQPPEFTLEKSTEVNQTDLTDTFHSFFFVPDI
jgi:hypothetical protein